MSVTAAELLQFAEDLNAVSSSEISRRTAVGRAYYCAYHLANDFHESLPTPGINVGNGGVHDQLYAKMLNPSIKKEDCRYSKSRRIAIIAKQIKAYRAIADYELNSNLDAGVSNSAIELTRRLRTLIDE